MSMAAWPTKKTDQWKFLKCRARPEMCSSKQGLSHEITRRNQEISFWRSLTCFVEIWPISTHINIISVLQLHLDLNWYLVELFAKSKHACFSIQITFCVLNPQGFEFGFPSRILPPPPRWHFRREWTRQVQMTRASCKPRRSVENDMRNFGSRKTHTDHRFLWIDKTCQLFELSFYDLQNTLQLSCCDTSVSR